jgi:hypothetical protein
MWEEFRRQQQFVILVDLTPATLAVSAQPALLHATQVHIVSEISLRCEVTHGGSGEKVVVMRGADYLGEKEA